MKLNDVVAAQIRHARLEKDWSQEYAAEQIPVSVRAWVKWEARGKIPIARLEKIAKLFGKNPMWFFDASQLPKGKSPGARAKKQPAPVG